LNPVSPIDLLLPASLLAIFVATVSVALFVTAPVESPAHRLRRHIGYAGALGYDDRETRLVPFRERVVFPLGQQLAETVLRRTPGGVLESTSTDLVMAGSRMNATSFVVIQTILTFGLPALALLYILSRGQPTLVDWAVLLLALFWGRRLPRMLLRRRIRTRQAAIDRRLPYAIDLIVACLEGGLSLDASMVKVADQSDGPLALEVRRTLHEMALGRPSAEAIRDLGTRTGAAGLIRLTEDIVQSERMGVSIVDSMRTLAYETRQERRQRAEEMARKAPIKMVPVLIFCVLPALAIVTMVPAGILLVRTLSTTR
jgi:tight adherence protein C